MVRVDALLDRYRVAAMRQARRFQAYDLRSIETARKRGERMEIALGLVVMLVVLLLIAVALPIYSRTGV